MTETEWLKGEDPVPLLTFAAPTASRRKVRLILTACCSRMLESTPPKRRSFRDRYEGSFHLLVGAHAVVERFADGLAGADELAKARVDAKDADYVPGWVDYGGETELYREVEAVLLVAADNPDPAAVIAACAHATNTRPAPVPGGEDTRRVEEARWQAEVVRCVLGNPFLPVTFDPKWRTETAVALASGIYAERAFDRMPILADALQDAGCEDEHLLAHCREPGPHVRGCWVVDLVLGKE